MHVMTTKWVQMLYAQFSFNPYMQEFNASHKLNKCGKEIKIELTNKKDNEIGSTNRNEGEYVLYPTLMLHSLGMHFEPRGRLWSSSGLRICP